MRANRQTDTQTYRHADGNTSQPSRGGASNNILQRTACRSHPCVHAGDHLQQFSKVGRSVRQTFPDVGFRQLPDMRNVGRFKPHCITQHETSIEISFVHGDRFHWQLTTSRHQVNYVCFRIIYTIIKTTSVGDARLSVIEVGMVDTRLAGATLSGRGAPVYTCTCIHDNIPCRRLPK